MTLGVRNYVMDPTLNSKYGSDRPAWGVSAHARNITVCDFPFLFFFGFFTSPTSRHSGPIFTIYTSNDAFSRKEVPFGGLDDEFLQRVSIACYAERCISYSKSVRLSVGLSVCPSVRHTLALSQNDSSYDHGVFSGG